MSADLASALGVAVDAGCFGASLHPVRTVATSNPKQVAKVLVASHCFKCFFVMQKCGFTPAKIKPQPIQAAIYHLDAAQALIVTVQNIAKPPLSAYFAPLMISGLITMTTI